MLGVLIPTSGENNRCLKLMQAWEVQVDTYKTLGLLKE